MPTKAQLTAELMSVKSNRAQILKEWTALKDERTALLRKLDDAREVRDHAGNELAKANRRIHELEEANATMTDTMEKWDADTRYTVELIRSLEEANEELNEEIEEIKERWYKKAEDWNAAYLDLLESSRLAIIHNVKVLSSEDFAQPPRYPTTSQPSQMT